MTIAQKVPSSSALQAGLAPPPVVTSVHLACRAGFPDRRGRAGRVAIPEVDDGADIRMLLQHGGGHGARGGRIPVRERLGDDLELGMLLQHLHDAVVLRGSRWRWRRSPCTRPISSSTNSPQPLTAASASSWPSTIPIAADEGVGREVHRVVDQDHVGAVALRLLQQAGIGVEVGRMHHQHIRLLGSAEITSVIAWVAGFGAPVRVAGFERRRPSPRLRASGYAAQPWARSKPIAIGIEHHALVLHRGSIGGRPRSVDASCAVRRCRRHQRSERRGGQHGFHRSWSVPSSLLVSLIASDQISPCCAVCSSRGLSSRRSRWRSAGSST